MINSALDCKTRGHLLAHDLTSGVHSAGDSGQAEIVAFLSNPKAYRPRPPAVERIVTHAAMVFLAGSEAYKIKQAVAYSYLDFSTLEKRKQACEHEFEVNHANAPDTYLGVVPIVRNQHGDLSIGGEGQVVEWAVHMRRFETRMLLSNLYATNSPPDEAVRDLADAVVKLHEGAPRIVTPDGAQRVGAIVEELRSALAEFEGELPSKAIATFVGYAQEELRRIRLCLKVRSRRECVRRCHGDLHLGNIVEIGGKPVLFDAIEFDDEIATIDVLYDLAFLIMDLNVRGYDRAANLLLNLYLKQSVGCLDLYGLQAMPLFLAIRAAIRAMVALQRGHHKDKTASAEAERYLDRAQSYLRPLEPRLIAIGGCSGTGKSTLARSLAALLGQAPGAIHVNSDVERKDIAGVSERHRLGPAGYTPEVMARVYERLQLKATRTLRSGYSVVVDATFLRPETRTGIAAVAQRLDVPFTGLWLTVPEPMARQRVQSRNADVSDATADVVARQFASAKPPTDWVTIVASGPAERALQIARLSVASERL